MSAAVSALPRVSLVVCPLCDSGHRPDEIVWLTTEEVAERFRTSTSSVRDWSRRNTGPRGSALIGKKRLWPKCGVDRWQQEQIEKSLKENG